MTTLTHPASDIAIGPPPRPGGRKARAPLAPVALAAGVAGGSGGGAAPAGAARTVFNDRAAEQARFVQFADQLKYALRWDDLQRQLYPYAK